MRKNLLFIFTLAMILFMGARAQNSCAPPTGLAASLHNPTWQSVQLNWSAPTAGQLYWTNTYTTRIGMNDTADFVGAVRFTSSQLAPYHNTPMYSVKFVPGEAADICTYHVLVWQGGSIVDDTVFNPGTLVVNQQVDTNFTALQYNTVQLSTPVVIDSTQELWIGIRCVTTAGYPLGAGNNGGVFGYGDLLMIMDDSGGEWQTLTGGNPSSSLAAYNWGIIGDFADPSVTITGYNIYQDEVLTVSSQTGTSYLDSLDFGTYTFGVTAVYSNGCESDPATVTVTMAPNPCLSCLDTIQVGNGTTGVNYFPIGTYYNYSFTEQIYDATSLSTVNGVISCIAFQYIHTTDQDKDIVVYMGNTTQNTFSNSSDWIPANGMTKVFEGTIHFTSSANGGWVQIPLDTPFEYDGASNIVVGVLNNSGSYLDSQSSFNTHSASSKAIYVQNDGSAYNPNAISGGTVSSNRPNIRFMTGEAVECPMPAALTVNGITTETATVSWMSNENYAGYEYVLVPEGGSFEAETPQTVSDTSVELSNLLDATTYTFYVRAQCSSSNSNWAVISFKTLCLPLTTLPYTMGFEGINSGTGNQPDCWEIGVTGNNNGYPYVSSSYYHTGNRSLYFYSYSPNSAVIRGQGLDLTENTDPLVMSFWEYKTSSSYGYIQAGYMTDPTDFSTYVNVKTIYPDEVNMGTWVEFKFALPSSVNGQVIYPVLYCPYAPGSNSNYIYVDDISIRVGDPECLAPSDFDVENISYTSAHVTFTPASMTVGHVLECLNTTAGQSNTVTIPAGSTDYMLTGLDTNMSYTLKLYPDCNGTPDTLYNQFLTISGTVTYCQSPDTSAQAITSTNTSTSYNIPVNNFYRYTYSQQIFTPSEVGGPTVITGVAFNYAGANASTDKNNVVIYLAHRADSTFSSTSDWTPINTAVKVYEGALNCTQGWNTFDFDTYFPYNGTSNLVLIVDDNSNAYDGSAYTFNVHTKNSDQYPTMYVYSDGTDYNPANPPSGTRYAIRNNIRFFGCNQVTTEEITCREPNVLVTGYDSTSITVSWVAGGSEDTWALEYKAASDASWTFESNVTGANTYTIANLTPNMHYDIRMCSLCSASDSSAWTQVEGFTVCEYINVPYAEDFETATGSGSSHMLPCWFRGTNSTTQYPYTSSTQHASGSYSLYFYGSSSSYSFAAMPKFADDVVMDSLVVKFKVLATSASYSMEMGIMSDPTDQSTFVPLATCTPGLENVWKNFEVKTENYDGNGRFLAFRIPAWGSSYTYLDDVEVDYMLPCSHPTNLTVQSVTNSEATIGWTAGDEETEWEYVYGLAGTVDLETASSDLVTNNAAYLSNLSDNTVYDFYVRALCSADEISSWESFSFRTECIPLAQLPYTENFDSVYSHTSNVTSGPNNLTNCWDAVNTGSSYTAYPYVYYSSSYAESGSYSLRFYTYTSSSYSDQYAILPPIDANTYPINTLQLTFDARRYSTSYPFCLVVGAMNGTDLSTFQPIDTVTLSSGGTDYDTQILFFSNYSGTGDRIALMAPMDIASYVPGAYYNQGHIDNVVISVAPSCPQPTHLTVTNATSDAVTLSWTENGTANNWVVEYGAEGFTPGNGTTVQTSTNPFTVDNLASATTYDFYVKADCGGGEESPYSNKASATPGSMNIPNSGTHTITTCAMVLYDDGGPDGNYSNSCDVTVILQPEVAGNAITIQGTSTTESTYDYLRIYDGAGTSGTMLGEYTGSGLTVPLLTSTTGPLTIHFSSDGSVPYAGFALTVSCISNTCPPPASVNVSNIGNTSATVSWTPTGTETGWIVEYKPATAANWTVANANTTSYNLTGLTGLTTYQVRVKADCGDETSAYKTTTFTTPNCAASDACQYTFILSDDYGDGWNDGYLTVEQGGVSIATLEAVDHGLSGEGSVDTMHLMLCDNNSTSLVWHSGDYDGEVGITILGPDGTQIYTVFDLEDIPSTTIHTFTTDCSNAGPVQTDPTVATTAATAVAQTTATLNGTITNPDNVTISAKGFEWKATTGGTYTQIAGTGTGNNFTANLTGLTANTGYTFKAFITYNGTTVYGSEMTFTTLPQGVDPCAVPTGLHTTNIENHAITIAWDANASVESWNIQYRVGTGTWSSATSTTNSYTITNLQGNTDYEIQVQANCGNGNLSDWSSSVSAHTTNVGIVNFTENNVILFPNPAREYVDIRIDGDVNVTNMEVFDVYGKLINTVNVIDNPTRINVSSLANGMYFVRVTTDKGAVTKTFVKK